VFRSRSAGGVTRAIWPWARVLGGIGILALLVWRVGTSAFVDGLRVIHGPVLAVTFAIGVLTTVFSAWRWCLVARGLGMKLRLRDAIADYYRALFLNAALPGGILGDVHRAVRHGRNSGDLGRGVKAVALERSAGQLVLVVVGVIVLVGSPYRIVPRAQVGVIAAIVALAVAVTGLTVGILARRRASRWAQVVRGLGTDVRRGLLGRNSWAGVLLASVLVLTGHILTFVVAAHAAGSTVPFLQLVPLMVLALLAMTVPVNIAGWGPREGVTAWAFGAAGLSAANGVTIAVVYGLFAFAASLPGAAVLIARGIARVRAARARVDHRTSTTGASPAGKSIGLPVSRPAEWPMPRPAIS
jgi:uncharacterized membrane protein YbhN (UPF0104 family)